jgi:hypothetical protein
MDLRFVHDLIVNVVITSQIGFVNLYKRPFLSHYLLLCLFLYLYFNVRLCYLFTNGIQLGLLSNRLEASKPLLGNTLVHQFNPYDLVRLFLVSDLLFGLSGSKLICLHLDIIYVRSCQFINILNIEPKWLFFTLDERG